MTSTPDTRNSSSSNALKFVRNIAVLIAVPVVVGFVHQATSETTEVGVAPMARVAVVQQGADPEGGREEWWTTVDCPAGVTVPCVDPAAAVGAGLPVGEQGQAITAEQQCLAARGYATSSARADDLELCRRAGVAAVLATHADQAAAAAPHHTAKPKSSARGGAVTEDSPAWSCARNGNHVCGPGNPNGAPAGCYHGGQLVIPWSNYSDPKSDPLYGQFTAPC